MTQLKSNIRYSLVAHFKTDPIFRLATTMDFRFKGDETSFSNKEDILEAFVFNEKFSADAADQEASINNSNPTDETRTEVQAKTKTKISKFEQLFGERFAKRKKVIEGASEIGFEVSSYLALGDHCESQTETCSPLKGWDDHKSAFPKLAEIAMKLFTIVTTSASAKRVFSVAGNIITAKRSNISPELVDMIIFLYEKS
ncbi:Zinc finger MYM-type-like protein [Daphnia magna]|uniref:Zinc finger MYM-type-like protein n=1 Tax=Daphnia magna TaxID=35525 RepID=A0A162RI52_9CRUS|nr:Zinc finger MYM-type-like protein [Daphnia magna]